MDETTAKWTYDRIEGARDAFGALLARLDLDTYRFAIEPRGDHWEAQIEFATTNGWKTTTLDVDESDLFGSSMEARIRDRLIERLGTTFADAKRSAQR